jgi:hypothetical protein
VEEWAVVPSGWVRGLDCDALVVCHRTVDALAHAIEWNAPPVQFLAPDELRATVARWRRFYAVQGIGAISFGAVVLRRPPAGAPAGAAWHDVVRAGSKPGERAASQLLGVLDGRDLVGGSLLDEALALRDGVSISQRFQRRAERFVARPAVVRFDGGLGIEASLDPDTLPVVFALDGRRALREVIAARAAAEEPSVAAVRELLRGGFLTAGSPKLRPREPA